jgi:tetratricopeptide (TPR) repeat protein
MGINTYEVMYIQARDNYPYNVDECIEKLQYVIAADDEHAGAHFLMGCIYEEQLEDYKQAEHYYRKTIYLDPEHLSVYYQFARMLINRFRLEDAQKVIDKGNKAAGIDLAVMASLQGFVYERHNMYKKAIEYYTEAKTIALNNDFISDMDSHIKRVKDKKALIKKKTKKKKSKVSS